MFHGVDTEGYIRYANEHDMLVLATGQVPNVGPDPYAQLAVEEAEDEEEKAKALLENAPPIPSYEKKVQCCGADMIVTPRVRCAR